MADLFGLYVHWPFCKAKCPYCDFNSHVAERIDHQRWRESYIREMDYIAAKTEKRELTSIFFGGGTPSLMEPETVRSIIDHAQKTWQFANNIEITLEANPTSFETEKFQAFKEAGVNRVSIGVQSLSDKDLSFLGREHSAQEALQAVQSANKIFGRVSFDLIYARPEQTLEAWEAELDEALEYAKGHLSLYQLTIEPGTPFFTRHKRGDFTMPEDDRGGAFYERTQEIMAAANLPAYEVSNHAAKSQESLHNLAYWRYADYAGIGPGAHGRLTIDGAKLATRTHRAPDVWLEKVEAHGHGYHPFDTLDATARLQEMLMMGLRLREGVPYSRIEHESGKAWQDALPMDNVRLLEKEKLLEADNDALRPTLEGMQRLNGLLYYLLPD
jgi:oxygen-independent coproporphyrinogen-3 oxidase